MTDKIRVLIVDDSAVMRSLLTKILSKDSSFEIVGTAPDPYIARDKIAELSPDVLTLDIEMPKMDGLTFLKHMMKARPTRTLVFSSFSKANSETAILALEYGAIDVMQKPEIDLKNGIEELAIEMTARLKVVAKSKLPVPFLPSLRDSSPSHKRFSQTAKSDQVLVIASSTGGTEALRFLLPQLPENIPGILIVQHMPPVFTKEFARSLDALCAFEVKEAEDGDPILNGRALLCPGDFHMNVVKRGSHFEVKLHQEPKLYGVRPAADFTMISAASLFGRNAIGLVLTGMGKDGAKGLLSMKKAGAFNIAQDEASCVVFGMPKEAIELGAVDKVLPLDQIKSELLRHFRGLESGSGISLRNR